MEPLSSRDDLVVGGSTAFPERPNAIARNSSACDACDACAEPIHVLSRNLAMKDFLEQDLMRERM